MNAVEVSIPKRLAHEHQFYAYNSIVESFDVYKDILAGFGIRELFKFTVRQDSLARDDE